MPFTETEIFCLRDRPAYREAAGRMEAFIQSSLQEIPIRTEKTIYSPKINLTIRLLALSVAERISSLL